jgi:hypothetical protein
MTSEKFYPTEKNLGKDCRFWQGVEKRPEDVLARLAIGCHFPKAEMEGRLSCEGVIDDVCLYLKNGRYPKSLSEEQITEMRHRIPGTGNQDLPPGDIYKY